MLKLIKKLRKRKTKPINYSAWVTIAIKAIEVLNGLTLLEYVDNITHTVENGMVYIIIETSQVSLLIGNKGYVVSNIAKLVKIYTAETNINISIVATTKETKESFVKRYSELNPTLIK